MSCEPKKKFLLLLHENIFPLFYNNKNIPSLLQKEEKTFCHGCHLHSPKFHLLKDYLRFLKKKTIQIAFGLNLYNPNERLLL